MEDYTCDEIWVGKPEGKILLGRPSRRWEENFIADVNTVITLESSRGI
jgi:hypothetical protein